MADVTNSTPSYLGGDDNVLSSCLCYLGGSDDISGSQSSYTGGSTNELSSQPGYASGSTNVTSSCSSYLSGTADISQNQPCYTGGSSNELSSCPSYLCGSDNETSSQACYLSGLSDIIDSISGYVHGEDDGLSSVNSYTNGNDNVDTSQSAYILGCVSFTTEVYLAGNIFSKTSQSAFIPGMSEAVTGTVFAYCTGIKRDLTHAYLEGVYMTGIDYIWLKTSDGGATLSKKFRVLAQDYDDGTLEKSEEVNKTIGGGIDHSVGAVYKTWSPIIRVRHTEPETDYGTKQDLEDFYELNNPNGTPSNDITFIDHHSIEYTVHTVGKLSKNAMGCQLEGECAWFLYRLQFIRVQ